MPKPEEQRDSPEPGSQKARELLEQVKKDAINTIHDGLLTQMKAHDEIECKILALIVAELLYDFELFKQSLKK